jgi:L-aminopeptidase/D-esterase-like protein
MGAAVFPAGVLIGHWSDPVARTGCTVLLAAAGAMGGVDVRGGAPGTLGTDALRPGTVADRVHAILLTGGSAFGLAAADGVISHLEEHGIGLALGSVRVPIVAGAVIFDLLAGDPETRPDRAAGYAACAAASGRSDQGTVGAGTGATVAKVGGGPPRPGGLGIASAAAGDAIVTAVMVANSAGGIWDDELHEWIAPLAGRDEAATPPPGTSTTIGAVLTDALLTKEQANRVSTVAHDGIARAVRPAHTLYDGDTMFCLATGGVSTRPDLVEAVAADVVARAIAAGVRAAQHRSLREELRRPGRPAGRR